jgi:hypothetical protein
MQRALYDKQDIVSMAKAYKSLSAAEDSESNENKLNRLVTHMRRRVWGGLKGREWLAAIPHGGVSNKADKRDVKVKNLVGWLEDKMLKPFKEVRSLNHDRSQGEGGEGPGFKGGN